MRNVFIILAFLAIISCDDNKTDGVDSRITLMRSSTEYVNAFNGNLGEYNDPFDLVDFRIEGDSAYIKVSYSGGCNRHTFEVIWSESYIKTNPPLTDILIIHDSHGDMCEAYVTETLVFSLSRLFGPAAFENVIIKAINGHSPAESLSAGGWDPDDNLYEVVFPEGDACQVEVTAAGVICGAGLYDNLWLAMNDSVSSGNAGFYFKKYLQPVALDESVKNFKPVPGKKYLIGARIQNQHPFTGVVICMAYSGPSVPVRITCVTELP